jgi:hypothetical protein
MAQLIRSSNKIHITKLQNILVKYNEQKKKPMKRITAILILTFICLYNTSFAQTKTLYEKKKEEISIKYLKKMGVSVSEINRAKTADESGLLLLLLVAEKVQAYQYSHGMESLVLMSEWEKEVKAAEKLKGEADFKKERDKKLKDEQIAKAKQEQYQKEKLLEEKNRESERIAKENAQEKQYQEALIKNSDFQEIKSEIKSKFEEWASKGEFETQSEYEMRLQNKKIIIDSIAFHLFSNKVTTIFGEYSNYNGEYSIKLKEYNIDKKLYPITLKGYFYKDGIGNVNLEINDTLNVDVNMAKKIKNIARQEDYSGEYEIGVFQNENVKFSKNMNDWQITKKGYFFPKTYTFFNQFKHTMKDVSTSVNEVKIQTNELGLSNYFSTDYSIDIDKYWIKKMENERTAILIKAERFLAENKFEQAKNLFIEANNLRFTEDVKNKLQDVDIKIIELKRNELIKSAEQYESNGNISNSIEKLEKSKELFSEANKLKFSESIKMKIVDVENKIIVIKQIELVKSAEHYENLGKISNSIEKLQEANKLKVRTDLSAKIDGLIKNRDMALTNHRIMDSLLTIAESEKLNLFNDIISTSSLDEIKKGYGQKYLDCQSLITSKINSLWMVVSNTINDVNRNRNREIWTDKYQELLLKINEFRNEVSKHANFQINIQKAILEKNKKDLKILKEDDINVIIETVIKTN